MAAETIDGARVKAARLSAGRHARSGRCAAVTNIGCEYPGSHRTPRWREVDSNHRSPSFKLCGFTPSEERSTARSSLIIIPVTKSASPGGPAEFAARYRRKPRSHGKTQLPGRLVAATLTSPLTRSRKLRWKAGLSSSMPSSLLLNDR